TGAVGTVTLRLLRERGYENVRAFASARSAGRQLGSLTVEEATAETLLAGGLDLVLFSCGTSASRELVPDAVEGGALVVDKSSAYRLADGYPLAPPGHAKSVLAAAPSVRLVELPTPRAAAQTEEVLVGRIRPDRAAEGNGLVLFLACDNLVKGAALNALQIAELLLEPARTAA